MIRDEIARAWAEDPRRVIVATIATIAAAPIIWLLVVAFLVGMQP